jgi:MEMO1 family protein
MIREASWAGKFYPADEVELTRMVEELLSTGSDEKVNPWGVLVPHAGYPYSGATAAMALSRLDWAGIKRVIMLGPAHHSPVEGVALTRCQEWNSPLGSLPLDLTGSRELLDGDPLFQVDERAHTLEHSLEVQLPFLKILASGVMLLPMLVGHLTAGERDRFLSSLKRGSSPGDLWLVTTDLSHFHSREEAEALDALAESLILEPDVEGLAGALDRGEVEACGASPVLCLLAESVRRDGRVELVDRRDSSASSGDSSSVVGYLSALFLDPRS